MTVLVPLTERDIDGELDAVRDTGALMTAVGDDVGLWVAAVTLALPTGESVCEKVAIDGLADRVKRELPDTCGETLTLSVAILLVLLFALPLTVAIRLLSVVAE